MADCTNCVVAIWSVLVPEEAVGATGTPVNVGASVNASVLRVGVTELLVSNRLVPSNSTEPKTGVVRLMPVTKRRGAADAVPVGRTTVPVNVGLANVALRLMLPLSLLMAVRIVSVARIVPELPAT